MKLVKNILSALVALPLVAGLASCSEKEAEYSEAAAIANDEVYFVSPNATVELDASKNVAYVDINRVKTADEITVPLNATSNNPNTIPVTSVTFKAGESVAQIPVSYNPEDVEAGKFDTLTFEISSTDYTTPYGSSSVTVLFGKAETWTSLGIGQFVDNFMDGSWYDVVIEQCDQNPNTYRIVDPYKEMVGTSMCDPYFYFYTYKEGDVVYGSYTAPYTGFAYYDNCNTGYKYSDDYGYYMPMHPSNFKLGRTEEVEALNCVADRFEDGRPAYFTFTSVYGLSKYGGAWDYSTYSGLLQIVMPGYVLADCSAEVEYTGKFINTDDEVYAVADITLGGDVKSAKVGVVAGKASDEGLDSVRTSGMEITAGGEYKLAMPENAETGNYTIYVITYNSDGDEKEYAYSTFKYVAGAAEEETWTAKYVGTWTYTDYAFSSYDEATETYTPNEDKGLVLYQSDQNPENWKIEHLWNDVTFYFSWDQTNNVISFEDQFTGANWGYGDIYAVDLSQYGYDASYYDQSTGTFKFNVYYADDNYEWGKGFEDFKLTGYAEAAKRAMHKAAARKHFASRPNTKAVPMKASGIVVKGSGKASSRIKSVKFGRY